MVLWRYQKVKCMHFWKWRHELHCVGLAGVVVMCCACLPICVLDLCRAVAMFRKNLQGENQSRNQ